MRIVYLGSSGPLSVMPLQGLLEQEHELCAVVLERRRYGAAPASVLPVVTEHTGSVEELAHLNDIAVILLDDWSTAMRRLQALAPDVILVSCFARRLPAALLSLPVAGCFNLHPSLLPAYRGPDPLFWQFRDGADAFGVSWHRMSAKMDAGAVVGCAVVSMPDGVSARQAAVLLGGAGSASLANLLRALERGALQENVQDEKLSSSQGFPQEDDFIVSPVWPARRLYNFMCATCERGRYYRCEIDGRTFRLLRARGWTAGSGPVVLRAVGKRITFGCSPGSVTADFI